MILYLLFFCIIIDSMVSISTNFSESVMCDFKGNLKKFNDNSANLDPKNIPIECDVIVYSTFTIKTSSLIDVDEALLKSVTDLKKPVIVTLEREHGYKDWLSILGPDGNAFDTKVLCDFAIKHNVQGYVIRSISPLGVMPLDETVGIYLIAYIKQLKQCKPELIIGVSISKSAVINSSKLNNLVTFYEIKTDELIQCFSYESIVEENNTIISHEIGKSPNPDYASEMRKISLDLKATKISVSKLTYEILIYPIINGEEKLYTSYTQVCRGPFDKQKSCIQTSKDFYYMGQFVRNDSSGFIVKTVDCDDINNDCGCNSAFNAFKSIFSGFTGGSLTPCPKFDAI